MIATSTVLALLAMHPMQAAHAIARAAYDDAYAAAEAAKVVAGIDYTGCDTEAAINEMADREGAIDDAHEVTAKRNTLTRCEGALIAWGIEHACGLPGVSASQVAELRRLRDAAAERVTVRAKVVDLCMRLAVPS